MHLTRITHFKNIMAWLYNWLRHLSFVTTDWPHQGSPKENFLINQDYPDRFGWFLNGMMMGFSQGNFFRKVTDISFSKWLVWLARSDFPKVPLICFQNRKTSGTRVKMVAITQEIVNARSPEITLVLQAITRHRLSYPVGSQKNANFRFQFPCAM